MGSSKFVWIDEFDSIRSSHRKMSRMRCHFIIPYALWPNQAESAQVTDGLPLPTYALLAGRGRHACFTPLSTRDWFAQSLGWSTFPVAPLTLLASGIDESAGYWMRADPVSLSINQRGAEMTDPARLDVTAEEADQLVAALNHQFSEDGLVFRAAAPGSWLVKVPEPALATFSALDAVYGRNVGGFLPGGEGAAYWHRLINEIQMLLYAHPVNDARASRNQLLINSVWLWGGGANPLPPILNKPEGLVHSNDLLLAAMATHAGAMCVPCPGSMDGLSGSHALVFLDELLRPALWQDALSWREAWRNLEHDWFVPARELLQDGQLKELHITLPEAGISIVVRHADLWRFWRRPRLPCA